MTTQTTSRIVRITGNDRANAVTTEAQGNAYQAARNLSEARSRSEGTAFQVWHLTRGDVFGEAFLVARPLKRPLTADDGLLPDTTHPHYLVEEV